MSSPDPERLLCEATELACTDVAADSSHDPTAPAEVVALGGTHELTGCTL